MAVVLIALGRRYQRDRASESAWKSEQERFFKERRDLGLAGDARENEDVRARTFVTRWEAQGDAVDGLGGIRERTDNCPSCHVGANDGRLVSTALPREFRAHPSRELLLGMHPPATFGCTSCHQGDGSWTRPHPAWTVRGTGKDRAWVLDADEGAAPREPMLRTGSLSRTRIDAENDVMEVSLDGNPWRKVVLGDGTPHEYEKEEELVVTLEAALQVALALDSPLASAGASPSLQKVHPFVRKESGRIVIGVDGDLAASSSHRLGLRFPKPGLAEMLGFARGTGAALAGRASYVAPEAPSAPVRADGVEVWGERGVYAPPRGARGLQIAPEFRDRFVLALPEIEAGCFRCHAGEADLRPSRARPQGALPSTPLGALPDPVPTFAEGRALYRKLGCGGCHALARMSPAAKSGPPLAEITAKTSPAWVLRFLRDPRAWSPRTTMPNHWPPPIDPETKSAYPEESPQHAAWSAQRDRESLSIAAWLAERSLAPPGSKFAREARRNAQEDVARAALVSGSNAEDGRAIFDAYGCRGCHTTSEADLPDVWRLRERDTAPSLARAGAKLDPNWVAYWLVDPARAWRRATCPSFRLDRREAASVAKFVATLRAPAAGAPGTEDEAAILRDSARRTEPVPCAIGNVDMPRAQCGEALAESYGCAGCHDDDGEAGRPSEKKVGPALDGWAARPPSSFGYGAALRDPKEQTRETFTVWKLDAPHLFARGGSAAKMPDHDLSAREIRALMVFLAGLTTTRPRAEADPATHAGHAATLEGAQIIEDRGCKGCHALGPGAPPTPFAATRDPKDAALTPPDLDGEGARVQPDWLFAFLKRPGTHGIRPALHPEWVYGNLPPPDRLAARMPTFALTTDETTAVVRYFALRDGSPFPYAPPVVRKPTSEEKLVALLSINAAGCLRCHYTGPFPNERAKLDLATLAPNLGLAADRLQPAWVEKFIAAPSAFAPRTKMPPFARGPAGDPLPLKLPPGYAQPRSADAQIALVRDLLFVLREKTELPKSGEELRSPLLGLGAE